MKRDKMYQIELNKENKLVPKVVYGCIKRTDCLKAIKELEVKIIKFRKKLNSKTQADKKSVS